MFYKLCPFCNEIKPIGDFDLTPIYATSCITAVCSYCNDLEGKWKDDESFKTRWTKRTHLLKKLKSRVVSRAKACIDMSNTDVLSLLGVSIRGYKMYLETFFFRYIKLVKIR